MWLTSPSSAASMCTPRKIPSGFVSYQKLCHGTIRPRSPGYDRRADDNSYRTRVVATPNWEPALTIPAYRIQNSINSLAMDKYGREHGCATHGSTAPSTQLGSPRNVTSFRHACIGVPPNTISQQFLKYLQVVHGRHYLLISSLSIAPRNTHPITLAPICFQHPHLCHLH